MSKNVKINIAVGFIAVYGVFLFINSLIYYFTILQGDVNFFRGIMKTIGFFLLAYFVYKRNKYAYWFALILSGFYAALGIFGLILLNIIAKEWVTFLNSIPTISLIFVFLILLKKEIRMEFKN
jgi:hypothetical protein